MFDSMSVFVYYSFDADAWHLWNFGEVIILGSLDGISCKIFSVEEEVMWPQCTRNGTGLV